MMARGIVVAIGDAKGRDDASRERLNALTSFRFAWV